MINKHLFIWVEGPDDQRFFEMLIKPLFLGRYGTVDIRTYASMKDVLINKFIKSIKSMGADCVFVADQDVAPCPTKRKQKVIEKYKLLAASDILVVAHEIESWYLAGIEDSDCALFKCKPIKNTDSLSKENFNKLITSKQESRIVLMIEILNRYSIQVAIERNRSLCY